MPTIWGIRAAALGAAALLGVACGSAETAVDAPKDPGAAGAPAAGAPFKVTRSHVDTHPSQGPQRVVEGSEALLVTWEEGAFVNIETSELEPGNVYTLWFIALNNPEACAERPCTSADFLQRPDEIQTNIMYGDGVVVPESGKATFSAFFPAGAWDAGWWDNEFDPMTAEIHATINSHGPLIGEHAAEMLHTYRDQCTDDSVVALFPEIAHADGEPGPNECALVQAILLMQE